jgi:hypothetical protein
MANPASRGQQRDKPFRDALRMEITAAGEDHKALRAIARNLIALASIEEKEAIPAIIQVRDTLDGKPAQAIVGDDEADPIKLIHEIRRSLVDPAKT